MTGTGVVPNSVESPPSAASSSNKRMDGFARSTGSEQRSLAPFRNRNVAAMDLAELRGHVERLGSVRAAARVIGCNHPAVLGYLR